MSIATHRIHPGVPEPCWQGAVPTTLLLLLKPKASALSANPPGVANCMSACSRALVVPCAPVP